MAAVASGQQQTSEAPGSPLISSGKYGMSSVELEGQDPWDGVGERLLDEELEELGLDGHTKHVLFEFDNQGATNYAYCLGILTVSLITGFFGLPLYFLCSCCVTYGLNKWTNSRKAALTSHALVLKWGFYACGCCCWNERSKTVPLDKITDLQVQKGCIQACFNVHDLRIETASSNPEQPEMSFVGIKNPMQMRRLILQARDQLSYAQRTSDPTGTSTKQHFYGSSGMTNAQHLSGPSPTEQHRVALENAQTLTEIRDLLTTMNQYLAVQAAASSAVEAAPGADDEL